MPGAPIRMRNLLLDLRVATVPTALVCAFTLFCNTAAAEGSAERGQQRAATCAACHGADGNSLNPEWPSLAGQHPKYIVRSLNSYRPGGGRNNVLMLGQVSALNDQDMQDLAAYYATKGIQTRTADPALVDAGERLYRGGSRERGISACIACHGPTGRGNPAAIYPSLSGQHAVYTANQLRLYKSGERQNEGSQQMRNIAAAMTEEDILAVSSYIQGLR